MDLMDIREMNSDELIDDFFDVIEKSISNGSITLSFMEDGVQYKGEATSLAMSYGAGLLLAESFGADLPKKLADIGALGFINGFISVYENDDIRLAPLLAVADSIHRNAHEMSDKEEGSNG